MVHLPEYLKRQNGVKGKTKSQLSFYDWLKAAM